MAVAVTAIHPDGSIDVRHVEKGCTGTLPSTQVSFAKNFDGTTNTNVLLVPCPSPNCGAVTAHPVTGGSSEYKDMVQQLFAVHYKALASLPLISTYAQGCAEVLNRAIIRGEGSRCNVVGTADPAPLVLAHSM